MGIKIIVCSWDKLGHKTYRDKENKNKNPNCYLQRAGSQKKKKKKKGGGSKNRVLRLSPALSTTRGKLAQPVSPAQLLDTRLPSSHIRNGLAPTQGGSKGTWTFAPFGSRLRSTNKTLPDFLLASKQIVLI